jgi:putative ABC transport system substrate-binding protein
MFWPCKTRTSTCRNFATISSGLYRFLAVAVLLDAKDIPQVGPLQWGRISGLMSHSASFHWRLSTNIYVGKILKGAKSSERPLLQPTTFEFLLNLKTRKALGLDVPEIRLRRQVIKRASL